ncbi:alpha-N-acetylgalactosamine-specific lectin-like [Branchiostoma floridae x Branchiostoma japonicum]
MRFGICYKAFDTRKSFFHATAACGEDGGTLAMPRDAETNAFLISLYKSVSDKKSNFLFGLHDQRKEGSFEWVDGSALGTYSSWSRRQPDNHGGDEDCVYYRQSCGDKWNDDKCDLQSGFICQTVPGSGAYLKPGLGIGPKNV